MFHLVHSVKKIIWLSWICGSSDPTSWNRQSKESAPSKQMSETVHHILNILCYLILTCSFFRFPFAICAVLIPSVPFYLRYRMQKYGFTLDFRSVFVKIFSYVERIYVNSFNCVEDFYSFNRNYPLPTNHCREAAKKPLIANDCKYHLPGKSFQIDGFTGIPGYFWGWKFVIGKKLVYICRTENLLFNF